MSIQAGQIFTDGTAIFITDDVRDGNRVGDIVMRHTLRDGFVKANGAVLIATDYPRLVNYAVDNELTTTETLWQAGAYDKYVYDSTANSLRVPNLLDRFVECSDAVSLVDAGIPNITGGFGLTGDAGNGAIGAFYYSNTYSGGSFGGGSSRGYATFNAARSNATYGKSNTVQPAAIKLIAQIKY